MFIRRHEKAQHVEEVHASSFALPDPSSNPIAYSLSWWTHLHSPHQKDADGIHWIPVMFSQWGHSTEIRRMEEARILFHWLLYLHCFWLDASRTLKYNLSQVYFLYKSPFFWMKVISSFTCLFSPNKANDSTIAQNLVISLHFTHTSENSFC